MLANVLSLHTSLTPGRSKGHFFFSVSSMLNIKLNGSEAENTMQANIPAFLYTRDTQIGSKGQNVFFFTEVGHAANQIKGKGL